MLKHNIVSQICKECGVYLFPPTEVSVIGQEIYEEVFVAPVVEPAKMPTTEELIEINKAREEARLLPFASVDEWASDYRSWAQDFRALVESRAQDRHAELGKGAPKVKELQIVEEAKAFKVVGKRWRAVYEETEAGWRTKCPKCGFVTLEWARAARD